jgi:hypothetical protein
MAHNSIMEAALVASVTTPVSSIESERQLRSVLRGGRERERRADRADMTPPEVTFTEKVISEVC